MKKVLSFVLVLSLVLSSFSMAFAGIGEKEVNNLSDIAGNANEEAIQVVNDLGIVTGNPDGTFQPDKAVNRAEFAAMVTRALGIPDSALAGYATTSFKDTNGYGWAVPYLAFCESKGIMLGDGAGNAMPGKTIAVNEAMTMVLRAVGYTANSSELVGTWPSNYVTKAQDLELYDDVSKTTTVDKANAAQIIYNALTVTKVTVDADGKTDYVTGLPCMLTSGLNCTVDKDVVIDNSFYDDSLIDVTKYIGAYGDAYYNDDDELVAFDKDSTTLTGEMDDGDFVVGDTTYTFKSSITTIPAIVKNTDISGGAVAYNTAVLDALEDESDLDLVINADVSGKTIKEIYSVVVWDVTNADLADDDVQADIEDDNELIGEEFVEDNNGDIDATQFTLVGVNSLKDIKEDDVVYVFCDDDDDIRMVAVGQTKVEGKVTKADGNDVYVNGAWYDKSDVAATALSKADIGDEYKLYVDAYGDYYDADKITGSVGTFGVVKSTQAGIVENTKIKMYTSADTTKTYTFADDDDDIDYLIKGDDADYDAVASGVAITAGMLVGYELDSNGDIDTLEIGVVSSAAVQLKSKKIMKVGAKDYDVDTDVVVFTYSDDNDGTDDYDIIKLSEVETGVTFATAQVIFNDDDDVIAFMIKDDPANVDKDTDKVYGVFHSRVDMQNEDDDDINEFEGFISGNAGEFATENDDYDGAAVDVSVIGQLYEIELTTDGTIDTMKALLNVAAVKDTNSGYIVTGVAITDGGISDGGTVLEMNDGTKYTVDEDAIVYEAKLDNKNELDVYKKASLSKLKKGQIVFLYDTQDDDCDMIADVVIFVDDDDYAV